MKAASASACKTILNTSRRDDANHVFQSVEEQQEEHGPDPEVEGYTMATALPEVIADEVKQQVDNALASMQ